MNSSKSYKRSIIAHKQNKNAFQSQKVATNEFSIKSSLFPELLSDTIYDSNDSHIKY